MKSHYINIFLFALPLNTLANTHEKPHTTPHTPKIPTMRSLYECDLYAPANYDSDLEMKKVMKHFEDRTSQRFKEYDERMKTTRQKCKDKCDKESQKIILKDKLEKQMAQQFATLDTDIQNDAISTCVCEKSIADKVEKGCLRCGGVLGGGVAPSVGLLGGIGQLGLDVWKDAALYAATKYAMLEGAAEGAVAGNALGINIVIRGIKSVFSIEELGGTTLKSFFTTTPYTEVLKIANLIHVKYSTSCHVLTEGSDPICNIYYTLGIKAQPGKEMVYPIDAITNKVTQFVEKAMDTAAAKAADVISTTTPKIINEKTGEIAAKYAVCQTTNIAPIIAIVVIVLIMVIIYLILRYRRKKKMKKKLQYIKLLEE
ncbi:rifin PIR protein,putative [Plasmodium sp. DRC-Itaito]|nr:rifin PIR protein,putative [Plasmodium sp. DRC-Itaito]